MSAPIGDAKCGGGFGTLPPPPEQKTLGRANGQSQSGNPSPHPSLAWPDCPALP
jgi:hypothetical protein